MRKGEVRVKEIKLKINKSKIENPRVPFIQGMEPFNVLSFLCESH